MSKIFGKRLSALRKTKGYTQMQLAEKLNISDKTVSKWESGAGYPDVSLLPALARVLGVTTDHLLCEENSGIAVAGNLIVDVVADIAEYPKLGMLTNILSTSQAVGGCVSNVGVDLAVMDPRLPVSALGCIGNDEYGRFLLSVLSGKGVDVSSVRILKNTPTSYCNVMSQPTGERTFFNYRGANDEFSPACVDLSALTCKILHIGYILLLSKFDAPDEEYGTVMARFLHDAQAQGLKTSIDAVSSSNVEEYEQKILPALKYCDYVILNELECCLAWGIAPRTQNGELDLENVRLAMEKTMQSGVKEKVIVHAKEAGFCLDKSGAFTKIGSLIIPKEEIKGSVGAGDAFCAGCLYGLYHEWNDQEILEYASAVAGCNLFAENSVDGMRSKAEIKKIATKYARRKI